MTRWGRAGNSQKHTIMPKDPTSWQELSKGIKNSTKCKKGQSDSKVDKSLDNIRTGKKFFKHNKTFCKVEVSNKSFDRNQKVKEDGSVFNSCGELKNAEECNVEEKAISKRQLKKLKREEKRKLKAVCNSEVECSNDVGNICKNVSSKNFPGKNEHCYETLKKETIGPITTNASSKKQKLNKLENKFDGNQKEVDSSPNKKKLKKKELFMKKLQERRAHNGITLLPPAAENRLYRIKKRLREKGYTPEMIKDIVRKERRKAELEFRKTSFQKTCFNCGQPGHFRADCHLSPNKNIEENKQDLESDYTDLYSVDSFGNSFLTCSVCKGRGHISRNCPDKKRSAVKEEEPIFTLRTFKEGESIDDEVINIKKTITKPKVKKPKVVVF